MALIYFLCSSYWQEFSVAVQHLTDTSDSRENAVLKSLETTQTAQGICHLLHVLFCGTQYQQVPFKMVLSLTKLFLIAAE